MSSSFECVDDPQPAWQFPIGVVIPTYNRSAVLISCLRHLERQTTHDFEVVIVDDGSTDSTPQVLEEYQRQTPLHLRWFRQDNSGPARARNVAIAALQSSICVMIGDDILVSPDFVSTHLELHRHKRDKWIAGLGLTRWCDSGQTITPFMRWLDESGTQFAYNDLLSGAHPSWKYFYTSNLSLKTQFLRENPFNEAFTKAAAEDLELGYRLEQLHGLEVIFVPEALAHHLHPTTFRQGCRRMFTVGHSFRLFHHLWPGAADEDKSPPFRRWVRDFMLRHPGIVSPLTTIANLATRVWCPNPLMVRTLQYHYLLGYRNSSNLATNSGATRLLKQLPDPIPKAIKTEDGRLI